MQCFENTTRITEAGYAAILRTKQRPQRIALRAIGLLLAVPLLYRIGYYMMLIYIKGGTTYIFQFQDVVFLLLFFCAIALWQLPKRKIKQHIQKHRSSIGLQTVNQYVFFPHEILMMSTASMEKFHLTYEELTWVRSWKQWTVLYFAAQNFALLIDRNGFQKGNVNRFVPFLKDKMEGK